MLAFTVTVIALAALAISPQAAFSANPRAWELVSMPEPSSAKVIGILPMESNGDEFIFNVVSPPPDTPSGAILGYGTAKRDPSGWIRDTSLGLPYHAEYTTIFPLFAPVMPIAFSQDYRSRLWIATVPLTPGSPPEENLALYRSKEGGGPEFIADLEPEEETTLGLSFERMVPRFADISSDGSRVVFTNNTHLVPADAGRTQGESIYTWNGGGLELVDVDNGGTLLSTCGSRVSPANGMSRSGNRVFLTVSPECGDLEKVYLRDLKTSTTVEISASECTRVDCNAPADVSFAGATREGEFAYLTTTQQLTNDDKDSGRDLYRYDTGSGKLSLVSGAPSEVTGEVVHTFFNSPFSGVVTPEDGERSVFPAEQGDRVYFRAIGEMIPGETTTGQKLFMADDSGLHLVADASFPETESVIGYWLLLEMPVQLSVDGKRALFVTQSQLLGTDTDTAKDAYLYDAEAETLTQVSRGPAGGNGASSVNIESPTPFNSHEYEFGDRRPYYSIDGSGDRVIFETAEALVSEDTNGEPDVYEWASGELNLITPGYQPRSSSIGGISRDGKTVAFATSADLVPADVDGEGRDLYVARLGGGFPEPAPPSCNSASCPLPAAQRVTRPTPASLSATQRKLGRLRVIDVAPKAKKGAIGVVVSVPAPGAVSGQIWAREGGKKVILASGSTGAIRPGKVRLALRLTSPARRSGANPKGLHLTVSAGSSKVSQAVKVSLR